MGETLFTKIINGDIPASFIAKREHWVAFLDINPRALGHTLVVPREPRQRIRELSGPSQAALMHGVGEVTTRLCEHFGVEDCTIVIHDGPTAGQEIPHVHIHIIPRRAGDGGHSLLAMFPDQPPPGSIDPDFVGLAALAAELSLD